MVSNVNLHPYTKGTKCCGVDGAKLMECANSTAPLSRNVRVAVLTQAQGDSTLQYSRYAAAVNAAWAAHNDYAYLVMVGGAEVQARPRL